jgi:hypothetical protein
VSLRGRLATLLAREELTTLVDGAVTRAVGIERAQGDARVREALSTALSRDDRANLEQGFRRLTSSTSSVFPLRDLQPLRQDQMLRLVYWLWESNPIAQWIIETTVDFVLGEGAEVQSEDPDVRRAIADFWGDPVNQLDRRMDTFARDYCLYGELCLPATVNEIDGRVRLAYVDPIEIDQVVQDPDNALLHSAVVLKARAGIYGGVGDPLGRRRVLKVIRADTARVSPYYGLMMPALPMERDPVLDVPYDGSCFLFQTNKVSNGRRGRSDLLALIDWLDGYDQFLFDGMDTASLLNAFVWDAKLEGYTEEQIRAWLATYRNDLKRNGVLAHNEKVTVTAVAPELKAADRDGFARMMRGHMIGSRGFPDHFFGSVEHGSGSSTKEMGVVPVKRLTRRQKELRYLIADLVRFQLDQKIRLKLLKPEVVVGRVAGDGSSQGVRKATDTAFKIVLPELSMKDQAGILAGLVSLAAALVTGVTEGWIREQTAAMLFANHVSQLGQMIDSEEEFTPGAGPRGVNLADYAGLTTQQMGARLKAQLDRLAQGNGDNANQPKATTPVGGNLNQ